MKLDCDEILSQSTIFKGNFIRMYHRTLYFLNKLVRFQILLNIFYTKVYKVQRNSMEGSAHQSRQIDEPRETMISPINYHQLIRSIAGVCEQLIFACVRLARRSFFPRRRDVELKFSFVKNRGQRLRKVRSPSSRRSIYPSRIIHNINIYIVITRRVKDASRLVVNLDKVSDYYLSDLFHSYFLWEKKYKLSAIYRVSK